MLLRAPEIRSRPFDSLEGVTGKASHMAGSKRTALVHLVRMLQMTRERSGNVLGASPAVSSATVHGGVRVVLVPVEPKVPEHHHRREAAALVRPRAGAAAEAEAA